MSQEEKNGIALRTGACDHFDGRKENMTTRKERNCLWTAAWHNCRPVNGALG